MNKQNNTPNQDFKNIYSVEIDPNAVIEPKKIVNEAIAIYSAFTDKNSNAQLYQEYFFNILAAIGIAFAEIFPDAKLLLLARFKGFNSFRKNLNSDMLKQDKDINTKYIVKDYAALTITLDTLLHSIICTDNFRELIDLEAQKNIKDLINQSDQNSSFISEMKDFIKNEIMYDNNGFPILLNEQTLLEKQIELLKRLINSTYDKCTEEVDVPYKDRLATAQKSYIEKSKCDETNGSGFAMSVSKDQIKTFLTLLNCLESRLDDKLQSAFLKASIPVIFNHDLLQSLHASVKFSKEMLKENGFHSIYFIIEIEIYIPDLNKTLIIPIELQAQSKRRFNDGKVGPSYHSGMPGKSLNILDFFEFKEDSIYASSSNSSQFLDEILHRLDNISYNNYLKQVKSNYAKRVEELFSHIKLKETIGIENPDGSTFSEPIFQYVLRVLETYCSDNYECFPLFKSAIFSNSVLIKHTHFFEVSTELLRKRDGLSVLSHYFIEEFQEYLKECHYPKYSKNSISQEDSRILTPENIFEFVEMLKEQPTKISSSNSPDLDEK